MAAPINLPQHHIRQETCSNRPAYREGRNPRAKKVYTINLESAYLLVQGVPALGNSQELVKLFAVHGAVEEYRILDEYPTADKYTDVFLIKFQRIQSARFAKKKLDDWSFYGGILHVSYAPEFESVEETRIKLQDRRKKIASRIRLLEKESLEIQKKQSLLFSQHEEEENVHGLAAEEKNSMCVDDKVGPFLDAGSPDSYHGNRPTISQSHNYERKSVSQQELNCDSEQVSYMLPHPPRQIYNANLLNKSKIPHKYEFAKVPTAHATLPKEIQEQGIKNFNSFNSSKTDNNSVETPKNVVTPVDKNDTEHDEEKKNEKIVNGLIVRDFSKKGPKPKFVPRQTLNLFKHKSESKNVKAKVDNTENETLKRNAFILGDQQGPVKSSFVKEKEVVSAEDKSIGKTVKRIRDQVRQVTDVSSDLSAFKKSKVT